jgi:hypothetical protein
VVHTKSGSGYSAESDRTDHEKPDDQIRSTSRSMGLSRVACPHILRRAVRLSAEPSTRDKLGLPNADRGEVIKGRIRSRAGVVHREPTLARMFHKESAARRDKPASTALRSLAVLTVLFKYASARQASCALYPRASDASRCDPL